MSWKDFLLRLAAFVVVAIAAMPLYALAFNGLVLFNAFPPEIDGFGNALTLRWVFVWLGCLVVSFGAIFIRENWGRILFFSPLYAPTLFVILYTLLQPAI